MQPERDILQGGISTQVIQKQRHIKKKYFLQASTKEATLVEKLRKQSVVRKTINWYPGHIAQAEKALQEHIKAVDVVVEIRDARVPFSTSHPELNQWCNSKKRILVLNKADTIGTRDRSTFGSYFKQDSMNFQQVLFTDAQQGKNIGEIKVKLKEIAVEVNSKRQKRGLNNRAVRACVVGYPNVGKSVVINKLYQKKLAIAQDKPGITKVLRWISLTGDLMLMDTPGIIPLNLSNSQEAAQKLAICNLIGEASYNTFNVAEFFLDLVRKLPGKIPQRTFESIVDRYKLSETLLEASSQDILYCMADLRFSKDLDRAGWKLLRDFRDNKLGKFALEYPKR